MLSIRTGHVSVTGNYRDNNEDSCCIDPHQRFMVVADGMGGQSAGERASAIAVELIPKRLEQLLDFSKANSRTIHDAMERAVAHANSEIMALSEVEPGLKNMGTTVVMMVHVLDRFYFVGVGDSRAYELRNGKMRQLTTDHSLTQALVEAGTISLEEAKTHRYRNVLYKYLGSRDGAAPGTIIEVVPRPGDRFLLCSDGLNDGLSDAEISNLLNCCNDPQKVAETLVNAALEGGSRDNISCVVVIVD